MKQKIKKFKNTRITNINLKKLICAALALLIIFSSVMFLFNKNKAYAAYTIGQDSTNSARPPEQRSVVRATNGTIAKFYYTSTEATTGLVYRYSTNSGFSWSSAALIDANANNDFTVGIDSNDNIYVVYTNPTEFTGSSVEAKKLTYNSGSWTVGARNTVQQGNSCSVGTIDGLNDSGPTLTIDSNNRVWVNYVEALITKSSCISSSSTMTASSDDGVSWLANSSSLKCNSLNTIKTAIISVGTNLYMICPNGATDKGIYSDIGGTGVWTQQNSSAFVTSGMSLVPRSGTELDLYYKNGSSNIVVAPYTIGTNTLGAEVIVGGATTDVIGQATSVGSTVYLFYQAFVAASSYNVTYKTYNGSLSSASSLTTDNLNNVSIQSPVAARGAGGIAVSYITGAASPYSWMYINSALPGTAPPGFAISNDANFNAIASQHQRSLVRASDNSLVAIYYTNTAETTTGLVFRKSTDNGATWGSSTQIASAANNIFAATIDSSNNVHISYMGGSSVNYVKLTYSGGNWSVGTPVAIVTNSGSACTLISFGSPTIAVNTSGTLVLNYSRTSRNGACAASTVMFSTRSTDGISWGTGYILESGVTLGVPTIISIGSDMWAVRTTGAVMKDIGSTGAWVATSTIVPNVSGDLSNISLTSSSSDQIDMLYTSTSGVQYVKYTISTDTAASPVVLGSASDVANAIVSGPSGSLYAVYSLAITGSNYNIVYKKFAVSTWDTNPTLISADGVARTASAPSTITSSYLPIIWSSYTVSPTQINEVTIVTNNPPAAATIISPASSATNVNLTPTFQFRTTDPEGDYLKYKLIIYNADCSTGAQTSDQTSSQTGWTSQDQQGATAYTGSSTISGSTIARNNAFTLSPNTTYCWKVAAIDPGGTNSFGAFSATSTFTTSSSSSTPSLLAPANGATGTSTNPLFQLRSSDADNDYLKYKILIYNSDCSTGVQTFDQTASQIGWTAQDQQSGTAYTGNSTLSSSTIATFGQTNLSPSTQYCWKAASIDPGGSNTWSSFSATRLFTTGVSNSGSVNITGGANIRGGAYVR